MFKRLAIAAALCLGFAGCATASDAREPRIVAVGDIHGDQGAWRAIIEDAGLVDARGRWTGGDAILVQTGDIPDRGAETREIIENIMKLEKQAPKKGGRVVALIGNHEAMNMTGDLRYTTPGEFLAFKTSRSRSLRDNYFRTHKEALRAHFGAELTDKELKDAFETEIPLGFLEHGAAWNAAGKIGKWVAGHDAVAKIGDTLFVHGGVSDAYTDKSIVGINEEVRAALTGAGPAAILTDEAGPLWYRGETVESAEGEAEVDRVLAAFGVKRIVIGHTPQLSGVKFLYGGKVAIIDTGASAFYHGVRGWLEISGGKAIAHVASEGEVK